MRLNDIAKQATATANEKGFTISTEQDVHRALLLIVGEVVEAQNELRNAHPAREVYFPDRNVSGELKPGNTIGFGIAEAGGKPEGFPIELADAVIRIANLCHALGIDLETAIQWKMAYNKTRPFRHGKVF
jgi:NTP pyrophosphatase (non-canonical NTP hydrolase)